MSLSWRREDGSPRSYSPNSERPYGSEQDHSDGHPHGHTSRGRRGRRFNSCADGRRGQAEMSPSWRREDGSPRSYSPNSERPYRSEQHHSDYHLHGHTNRDGSGSNYHPRGDRNRSRIGNRGRGRSVVHDSHREGRRGAERENSYHQPYSDNRSTSNVGHGNRCQIGREREDPVGFNELKRLLNMSADTVVLELLQENSIFHLLLKEDSIKDDELLLLIKVLAHATNTKSKKESLYELFTLTCKQKFMDRLCEFSVTVKDKYQGKGNEYFTDLFTFLNVYANDKTSIAIDRVLNVINACISVLLHLQKGTFVSKDILNKYEALQDMLTEASKQWEPESNLDLQGMKRRQDDMDNVEPHDDDPQISILPTPQDLIEIKKTFLKKNIVNGKYEDEYHYLDVQFKLLREDFVKPLRNGITDFQGGKKSRFKDIRIYRDVIVTGTLFNNQKMMHLVKVSVPQHKKSIKNSKRLLFGNLLCFSYDNFKTLVFGSVAKRDVELYQKEGIIGVKFESTLDEINLVRKFTMVESRAYFMAYKHVLKALQDMAGNGVPMVPYIIHIDPNVDAPKYLEISGKYDLRIMKKAGNTLIDFCDDEMPHLREVSIQRELVAWPSVSELDLDSSQYRALRSSLTRKLAIIQGPPGTGKTFIGLKITQILLHNSQVWKDQNHPTPIVVVCFTSHALDQFLEGMTPYTENIVRVGSKTKCESIKRFQIKSRVRSLDGTQSIPAAVHHEVMNLEHEIKGLRATLNACRSPNGIISQKYFSRDKIIPPHLEQQLSEVGLSHWLLLCMNLEEMERIEKRSVNDNPDTDLVSDDDDDEFNDAEDFYVQEEQDRRIVDHDDDDSDSEDNEVSSLVVEYEVTDAMLSHDMNMANAVWERDQNDVEAYFKYGILSWQREVLKIGLGLLSNLDTIRDLESQPSLDLMKLDLSGRWNLYKDWCSKLEEIIAKRLAKIENSYQEKSRALEEIQNQIYLDLMRHSSVVGMTMAGAAQYNNILQDLSPSIVIIEEAAEILESNVITALTSKCQHLIMLGDHQQLQPSATVLELATKYGLDTSMFERMIKNGFPYETLEYQYRMRPSISRLLVPSIYPKLKDHPSVTLHPHVKGISTDVFFINHQIPEKEESDNNNSCENQHEAELLIGLCRHLMLQGYSPNEVTILTPYFGQCLLLRKLQQQHAECQGVKICIVDSFQGNESNIILLSLVQSNVERGKVGFLRTDDRICVALSRAKHGLYATGNMDLLCNSSYLWKDTE